MAGWIFLMTARRKAKLLEYNADTPTTLYESAVFQWVWLEEAIDGRSNSATTAINLQSFMKILSTHSRAMGIEGLLHLACLSDIEDDRETVNYLEECAREAGLETHFVAIERHRHRCDRARFTDLEDRIITAHCSNCTPGNG